MIHPEVRVEVRPSRISRLGLHAIEPIEVGQPVVRWDGIVLTLEEVRSLPLEDAWRVIQVGTNAYDFSPTEGPQDFINHSCDPNLGYSSDGRLHAIRRIGPGEEITFDYSTSDTDGIDIFTCACNSIVCRGTVSANDWRADDFASRFEVLAPHVRDRIRQLRRYQLDQVAAEACIREWVATESPLVGPLLLPGGQTILSIFLASSDSSLADVGRTLEARVYRDSESWRQEEHETAQWHLPFEESSVFLVAVESSGGSVVARGSLRLLTVGTDFHRSSCWHYFDAAFPGEQLDRIGLASLGANILDIGDLVVAEDAPGGVISAWLYHALLLHSTNVRADTWVACINEAEFRHCRLLGFDFNLLDTRRAKYDDHGETYGFYVADPTEVYNAGLARLSDQSWGRSGTIAAVRRRVSIGILGVDPHAIADGAASAVDVSRRTEMNPTVT